MLTLPRISSGILLACFSTWSRDPPSWTVKGDNKEHNRSRNKLLKAQNFKGTHPSNYCNLHLLCNTVIVKVPWFSICGMYKHMFFKNRYSKVVCNFMLWPPQQICTAFSHNTLVYQKPLLLLKN